MSADYHELRRALAQNDCVSGVLPLASEAAEIIINTVDGVDPFVCGQFISMREHSRS